MADLRKKQTQQAMPTEPPARRTVDLPGLRGDIPFVVGNPILTEAEKQVFKNKFGWKEGDPIPNIAKVVRTDTGHKLTLGDASKAIKEAPLGQYDPEEYKGLAPPQVISLDHLPEAKRREIEESIQIMKRQQQAQAARPKIPFVANDPSIADALALVQAGADEDMAKLEAMERAGKVPMEDDRAEVLKQRATVSRPAAPAQKPVAPIPIPVEAPVAAPPVPPSRTVSDESDTGGQVERSHCQHCGWDLGKPDDVTVTLGDKRVFTAAMLGGRRFMKTYSLFGNTMRVTFRAPLSVESDRILHQIFLDGKAGRITSPAEVFRRVQEYQLAVCLQSLASDQNVIELPEIGAHEVDQDETTTGLPDILEYVYANAVPNESLRRVLLALYANFDNLLAKMEATCTAPDFLEATE